ncbi:hypothetical protein D3C85_1720620 [compost metagenome]
MDCGVGEGPVEGLDVVEVGQAGQIVTQGLGRQVALEQAPAQGLSLIATTLGV